MIELKTYHTLKSTEVQGLWQGDQFLFAKVATIAYKILVENVGIFLYNQSAKVRNYFKKDTSTPKTTEAPAPSSLPTPVPIPNYSYMFSKTVQGALLGTLMWRGVKRLVDNTFSSLTSWPTPSFFANAVPLTEKVAQCGSSASFQWINTMKQLELKYFALASAMIPFTINLVDAVQKEPKNLPLTTKISNAVKKQFSLPHMVFYGSMIGLALANPFYGRALGFSTKEGFDASGHLMLKAVLAPIVGVALSQTSVSHPEFAAAFAMVYSFTDGVFLRNTTNYCHTALESLAGYAWGIGIGVASSLLTHSVMLLSTPKISKSA